MLRDTTEHWTGNHERGYPFKQWRYRNAGQSPMGARLVVVGSVKVIIVGEVSFEGAEGVAVNVVEEPLLKFRPTMARS